MSVYTKMLASYYYNKFHWPFLRTVRHELLKQIEDNDHHSFVSIVVSSDMRVSSSRCSYKFLPHSSLGHNPATNTQYLLDDSLQNW